MRASLRVVLLLSVLLAACGSAPTETATATSPAQDTEIPTETATTEPTPTEIIPEIDFTFYAREPIIANGAGDHWTGKWMNPGGVVFHEGVFHMYMNAFHEWPGSVSIGHYTSEDGYDWTLAEEDPILVSGEDVPYDVSSAFVTPDGTWVLYMHQVIGGAGRGIIRATAPDAFGPWTVEEEPVLTKGSTQQTWDGNFVSWPSVVQTEDGYVMYYTGTDVRNNGAIGMATSPDGITWTKYDDPATTDDAYAESDPVLTADADWDGNKVDRARVQFTPDGWTMIYAGENLNNRGLAFSEDGIHWELFAGSPILSTPDFASLGPNIWDNNLFHQDGIYFWYMEIGSLSNTQIYLSTFEGSLLP